MIHVWHRTGAYRQRTGRDLLGPWNLQVFIIICSTVLTISKCGTPRKTYRHRCEKKKQLKILQILLAKQKPHLASALRTFFRIISAFELVRKLATTILFLIDIPEQWGCRFQLCFTYSKTKSHDDVGTAGIFFPDLSITNSRYCRRSCNVLGQVDKSDDLCVKGKLQSK